MLTKLLEKDPEKRLGSKNGPVEIMEHPFYAGIDWQKLMERTFDTPYKPVLSGATDTSHFDENQTKIMFTPPNSNLPIFEPEQGDEFDNFEFMAKSLENDHDQQTNMNMA